MTDHIARRDEVLEVLIAELLGPSAAGEEIDCTQPIEFDDTDKAFAPWRQKGSGEEILVRDPPSKRYGVGVLSPPEVPADEAAPGSADDDTESGDATEEPGDDADQGALTAKAAEELEKAVARVGAVTVPDDDDYELAAVNSYRPSTMAVTLLADLQNDCDVHLTVTGARYVKKLVTVPTGERTWWLRVPITATAVFSSRSLLSSPGHRVEPNHFSMEDHKPLKLEAAAYPRVTGNEGQSLVTFCLINRSSHEVKDECCLFQARFTVSFHGGTERAVLPYPEPEWKIDGEEEESLALLYRDSQTYAVGHGCAADWSDVTGNRADSVTADPLPVFEAPNISADILLDENGTKLEVSMAALAGLIPGDDGSAAIARLLDEYESWIGNQRRRIRDGDGSELLPGRYIEAADRHLDDCTTALERMRDGVLFLADNPVAAKAFRLANHAVLLQQLRVRRESRKWAWDASKRQVILTEARADPDPLKPPAGRGYWRPFQIAFLLTCIRSVVTTDEAGKTDRRAVELIWFPTGGGKTEAYLGLTAFSLFHRRLLSPDDHGVDVLMRYTLRLLTAQQFQRASALVCAMDVLRREDEESLGSTPFSIGLWLGGSVSPNRREGARAALRELKRGEPENPFVVTRCPWCSAQMGQFKYRTNKEYTLTLGYTQEGGTVTFHCPDPGCAFATGLPLFVIDEDIYEFRPSLVIGTVDKFAQLAWEPAARALFGIGADGNRTCSPPNLIIQDELHLISGPLGSMVGIFETVIEALCNAAGGTEPKIVSSTATIRRYEKQVSDLYARDGVFLFPPRGLDAGDSFFAHYARQGLNGPLLPGRKYVGIHAPGLGSMQTAQVRTFSALLQAPAGYSPEERDPWWTLMVFFNSLRELGTSLSLLQSDIPDYLRTQQRRLGLTPSESRRLKVTRELTGRLRNDEVPRAMEELEVTTTSTEVPVDVCLASNIIEVGIDIDRLSVMTIVGQPKTTSQYIQVTGRVGRQWWSRPALIATIYSPSKPRDRSHFEKFRSYHERLYAQVEPTSVTPFAPPVVDRALHAIMAAYVRQAGTESEANSPYPVPDARLDEIRAILRDRTEFVDAVELGRLLDVFDRRVSQWQNWQRTDWRRRSKDSDIPLLRPAAEYASVEEKGLSWSTPNSLRDVDAECELEITTLYAREDND